MTSDQPVILLGRIAIRRPPIAHLDDICVGARLERDLRQAPTPISGGIRKWPRNAARRTLRRRRKRA